MRITWADDIETALRNLGGAAHRSDIIYEVRKIRHGAGRSLPPTLEQTVQGALERHCRQSDIFNGVERFVMEAKGTGFYRLA